jgi:DNA-binding response OmpR family regulator
VAKTVLLAARPEETETFRSIIQEGGHKLVVADSLSDAQSYLDETQFQIAVIDEDFDGPSTGWKLAERIRRCLTPDLKIIVLTRGDHNKYFESKYFEGKFDWVMGFPISAEQLLHELNRKWPVG